MRVCSGTVYGLAVYQRAQEEVRVAILGGFLSLVYNKNLFVGVA